MKNTTVFLMLFLLSTSMYGQFEWVGDYGFSSSAAGLHQTKEGHFVLVRAAEDNAGFTVLDSLGNVLFNYSDPVNMNTYQGGTQGRYSFFEMTQLPDSSYVFVAQGLFCDTSGSILWTAGVSIYLIFDKNWNEVGYFSLGLAFEDYRFCAAYPDGSIAFANTYGKIQRRSPDGEWIWLGYDSYTSVSDMLVLENEELLLASGDGLYIFDTNGLLDTLYPNLIFDQMERTPDGQILAFHADTFFMFDSEYQPVLSLGFAGDMIHDYSLIDGRLAVLTVSKQVYVYDLATLDLLYNFEADEISDTLPAYIALVSDGVLIASTTSVEELSYAPFLKKYPFDGITPDLSGDVGVVAVEITDPPMGAIVYDYRYWLKYENLKVTVKNFGDEPVKEVKLNTRFPTIWIPQIANTDCIHYLYQLFHQKITGLDLAPGETVDLYVNWNRYFQSKPTDPFEMCFWSSLPNGRMDNNHDNDRFCLDFPVNDRELAPDFFFTAYPNPSTSATTIEYGLPPGHNARLRVFNSTGVLMAEYDVMEYGSSVALPKFPAGLYFVSLEVDGVGARTLKLVQL